MAVLRTRVVFLFVLALAFAPPVAPAGAGAAPVVHSEAVTVPSWDGTRLSAQLYWTAATTEAPAPAILMTHGWAGTKEDLVGAARWLAGLGYVVVAYDSRGFGASGGTVGLNGPAEQADARHLVTWIAERPRTGGPLVLLDDAARADPRIGMFGASYGGAIQLLAAAGDDRIDALVPDITWNHLEESLAPGSVVKRGWVDLLFWGGSLAANAGDPRPEGGGGIDPRLQEWYLESARTGRLPAEAREALWARSPAAVLPNVTADVLLTQGWRDTLFDPDEAVANHAGLTGHAEATTRLLFHGAGHGHAMTTLERTRFQAAVADFYAETLDGEARGEAPQATWYDAHARTWQESAGWPPVGVAPTTLRLVHPPAAVTLAQAGVPTTHTETQELEGTMGPTHGEAPFPTLGRWDLSLDVPGTLLGAPLVNVTLRPQVDDLTLFFALVDVAPDGTSRVVGNQVTPVRVEGMAGREVPLEIPLVSVAHTVQIGHGLALRIATSDSAYHGAREAGVVEVETGTLTLVAPRFLQPDVVPFDDEKEADPDHRPVPGAAPGAVLVALLLTAIGRGRSRRWSFS